METNQKLVWIDLEMTGLDATKDVIIEMATIITDHQLNIISEGPLLVIHQPDSILDRMDDWNKKHHSESGLVALVKNSTILNEQAESLTLQFLQQHLKPKQSPMCGNTIYHDRAFLSRLMPKLEAFFHYRHIDVSTVKELARRWRPELFSAFQKNSPHRALDDIRESIAELKYYQESFFNLNTNVS